LLRDWESFPCPQINYDWYYNTAQPDYGKRIASSRAPLAVMRTVIQLFWFNSPPGCYRIQSAQMTERITL